MNRPEMIQIYKPNGLDWLRVPQTKKDQFTFHHIIRASKGGKAVVDNGAILVRSSHDWIHIIETMNRYGKEEYKDLSKLFKELNNTKMPPCPDYWNCLHEILDYYVDNTIDLYTFVRRRTR